MWAGLLKNSIFVLANYFTCFILKQNCMWAGLRGVLHLPTPTFLWSKLKMCLKTSREFYTIVVCFIWPVISIIQPYICWIPTSFSSFKFQLSMLYKGDKWKINIANRQINYAFEKTKLCLRLDSAFAESASTFLPFFFFFFFSLSRV